MCVWRNNENGTKICFQTNSRVNFHTKLNRNTIAPKRLLPEVSYRIWVYVFRLSICICILGWIDGEKAKKVSLQKWPLDQDHMQNIFEFKENWSVLEFFENLSIFDPKTNFCRIKFSVIEIRPYICCHEKKRLKNVYDWHQMIFTKKLCGSPNRFYY